MPTKKGYPHPWRDGTQLSQVGQILFSWKHRNLIIEIMNS
jgi:hypothetical protein